MIDFNSLWGSSAELQAWSQQQITDGWTSRIPRYQYDNNFLNDKCLKAQMLADQAIVEWSTEDSYPAYTFVRGSNRRLFVSKLANKGNDPLTDSTNTYWAPLEYMNATIGEVRECMLDATQFAEMLQCGWKSLDGSSAETPNADGRPLKADTSGRLKAGAAAQLAWTTNLTTNTQSHTHSFNTSGRTLSISQIPDHTHFWSQGNPYDGGAYGFWEALEVNYLYEGLVPPNATIYNYAYTSNNPLSESAATAPTYSTQSHSHGSTTTGSASHNHSLNISGSGSVGYTPKSVKVHFMQFVGI